MSIRVRTAIVLGSFAILGAVVTPTGAASAQIATVAATAPAAVAANNGPGNLTRVVDRAPIRECFRKSCRTEVTVRSGTQLRWIKFAINQEGNRWYFVRTSFGANGWIFCGHVTAGCGEKTIDA